MLSKNCIIPSYFIFIHAFEYRSNCKIVLCNYVRRYNYDSTPGYDSFNASFFFMI